jgi:hypothetical protein
MISALAIYFEYDPPDKVAREKSTYENATNYPIFLPRFPLSFLSNGDLKRLTIMRLRQDLEG